MFERQDMGEVVDGDTIRFVRIVKHPPERVWRAITDEQELEAWMRYPVKFDARVGGRAYFFGEDERCEGKVFIFDPPHTLAYSFADAHKPDQMTLAERDWSVRWDLEPTDAGCRITFIQRGLGGPLLWGLGEGWHGFMQQLVAYFDGTLEARLDEFAKYGSDDLPGLSLYRKHVTEQLIAWASDAERSARNATEQARSYDALAAIDRLALASRQLGRIAIQEGARPDYSIGDANPGKL
jgi:uncharacterized protein YndB with AHSA1/START domain